jgi:2,4-diaminopentanoate dehydrogenase
MSKLRVVVIGTGNVGGIAVRCLLGREDVELVGVWGRTRNIGIDAGLHDTDQPCGVIVTDSEDAIFALRPDAAVMAINVRDPLQAQTVNERWFVKLLEHGINVVTASDGSLVFPPAHADQAYVGRLAAAALKGGASFYANGQEPGFVDHMALLAATLSNTIRRITSSRSLSAPSPRAKSPRCGSVPAPGSPGAKRSWSSMSTGCATISRPNGSRPTAMAACASRSRAIPISRWNA